MLVVLRTLEILAIFVAAGMPLNLALKPASYGRFDARLLLAPTSGLALVTIYAFFFLGLGQPIRDGVVPFWIGIALVWSVVLARYGRKLVTYLSSRIELRRLALPGALLLACLIAAIFFLLPFLSNPKLVFWHYSGTDGYFYMRVAEHLENSTRWNIPHVGPYDGASGFLAEDMRLFDSPQGQGDKPGTFGVLGGLAASLGLLPHEVYSPLVAAAAVALCLSLTWFGLGLGVTRWLAPLFALAGSVAMVVWYFGDNTFLGNMLTLPLVPAVLGLIDVGLGLTTGLYGGLLLGAMMVIFPTGPLAVVAVGLPSLALVVIRAIQQRRLARVVAGLAVWLGTTLAVMLPMLGYLLRSANILSFLSLFASRDLYRDTTRPASIHLGQVIPHSDWLWPAFNLNILPPTALNRSEKWFLALLIVLYVACLAVAAWHKRGRLLLLGVAFACMMLIGTLTGMVTDDYNLYRAAALFWLIPLVVLFYGLSVGLAGVLASHRTASRLANGIAVVAIFVLLARFARNDFRQFNGPWMEHLPDAQYTQSDIDDRVAISQLVGGRTITLSSETPTFTGFANVLMLFSSLHLGSPNYFYQFLFFRPDDPPKDVPYTSDLVLRALRYTDVYTLPADRPRLYHSSGYEVVQNDLVPFMDDDTLPFQNAFPTEFLQQRQLSLSRLFEKPTEVKFFSRGERDVHIGFRFATASRPSELRASFDGQPQTAVPVESDGTVALPAWHVAAGLHTLSLAAPQKAAELDGLTLD